MKPIADEIEGMYSQVKQDPGRSGVELIKALAERTVLLARSAELMAEAGRTLDMARGEAAEALCERKIPPSLLREIINGRTADQKRLYTQAERLNASIVHGIDAIRSLLSYEKEQQKL